MKIKNSKTAVNLSGDGVRLTAAQKVKLKKIILEILKDVKNVCETSNLDYYVSYGTLLGAIRHNGFIPWDDDIDICMKNDDILKLFSILCEKFPNKYYMTGYLYGDILDPFFGYKLMLNNTKYVEVECQSHPITRGINIDIFPIVSAPKNKFLRKIKYFQMRFLNLACSLRYEFSYSPKSLLKSKNKDIRNFYKMRRFLSVPTLIFTNRRWQKIRNHYLFKNYKNSNNYAFIYTGYKNREVCIDDLKDKNIVSFENIDFYTFRNPISFLETWYGKNWNIPPKVAEQECHPIFEIDFGNY